MWERLFQLSQQRTSVRTELLAGLTTFLTMAYIIFVQPAVLSGQMFGIDTGMDFGAVTTATCLSAALASAIMGLYGRYPIAQAPGMGENFFFVLTMLPIAGGMIAQQAAAGQIEPGATSPWQIGLGVVFLSGVAFLVLSLVGVRERLMEAISPSMRNGIAIGIGLFIAFIGLQTAGVVQKDPGTAVKLNHNFASPDVLIFFCGLLVTAALHARRVPGSIVCGIAAATLAALAAWYVVERVVKDHPAFGKQVLLQKTGHGLRLIVTGHWKYSPADYPWNVSLEAVAPSESRELTIELAWRDDQRSSGEESKEVCRVELPAVTDPAAAERVKLQLPFPVVAQAGQFAVNVYEQERLLPELSQPWRQLPRLPPTLEDSMLHQRFKPAGQLVSAPPSIKPTLLRMDLRGALSWTMLPFVVIFLFMVLFDTIGTLVGVAEQAGFIRENRLPRAKQAFVSDALGTVVGAALGTSTVTSFIESAAGVEQGGRTGLTAVTAAVLFLVALPLSPLIAMVGAYPPITAPALVVVGAMMAQNVTKIDWGNYAEAIPTFLIIIGIPFTYSIADGLAIGFIVYPIVKFIAGQGREVKWLMYLMAAVLVLYFLFVRGLAP